MLFALLCLQLEGQALPLKGKKMVLAAEGKEKREAPMASPYCGMGG